MLRYRQVMQIVMKNRLFLFLISFFIATNCFGEEYEEFRIGPKFNSVFQSLESGKFTGTVNGVLFITTDKNADLILDFQAGKADLNIIPDPNEVYDVSTKLYTGWTTSAKTKILYSTYSMANKLTVVLSSGNFTVGSHDGASYMVINGVNYQYKAEEGIEYLVITFYKDVKLNNFWWLRDQGHEPKEARKLKKEITIEANSTLLFAIKRK